MNNLHTLSNVILTKYLQELTKILKQLSTVLSFGMNV